MMTSAQQIFPSHSYAVLLERLRLLHRFEHFQTLDEDADVVWMMEVVWVDDRRVVDTGSAQRQRAEALRSEQCRVSHGKRVSVDPEEVPKRGQIPVVGTVLNDGRVQAKIGVELKLDV